MQKMKAIIIDDEKPARIALRKLLEWNAPFVEISKECGDVDEAILAIKSDNPDLIFLDIEMPVKNGFDLLQEIDQIDFEIIFVTAHDQFAIEAFKRQALAYLLKPVDEDELKRVIERAQKQRGNQVDQNSLVALFESLQMTPKFNKIAIPTLNGLEFINIDQISRCSSDGNYTHIHIQGEGAMLVSKNLKQIEEQLKAQKQFVRVHNSHIVNLFFVKKYNKGKGGYLIMEDGSSIPISRARKDDVLSNF